MISRFAVVVLAVTVAISPSAGQEHAHPVAERLGKVPFPTSCNARVAPGFDRSIALLHSFEFASAIKGFQEVLASDSTCAMAYWGIALSRWGNPMAAGNRASDQLAQGRTAAARALAVSSRATERERGYINAVKLLYDEFESKDQRTRMTAYERAMDSVAIRNPADTEAAIFHAISLVATASPSDKTYANQRKAGRVLETLWAKQPDHPGLAHYIIHAYDYPALASDAARAAHGYAAIAPSAAHALHMPSHIFTRTGSWEESIATNLRSIEVAKSSSSIAEALHASDYVTYAYLQLRRDADAKKVLEQLPALAAVFDPKAVTGAAPGSAGVFALAAIPARYALERDAWSEAATIEPKSSSFPWTDAMIHFARALGASRTGDTAKARISVDSLAAIRDRLASTEPYWSEQVAIQHLGALAWLNLSEGSADSALALMRRAAEREDATEKSAVTPGPLAPARELLGDMLLELKQPVEAAAEYRKTLAKEPGRRRSIAGLARATAAR